METQLITRQGLRAQTLTGPAGAGADVESVLVALQDAYLIRTNVRAGASWYELASDQLIRAIREDNASWMRRRLAAWQVAAREWAEDRDPSRLLRGSEALGIERAASTEALTPDERAFLQESARTAPDRLVARVRSITAVVVLVALLELVVIVVLLLRG